MEKKQYIIPSMKVSKIEYEVMICGSGEDITDIGSGTGDAPSGEGGVIIGDSRFDVSLLYEEW